MFLDNGVSGYLSECQKLRTIARQSIENGYCLIVEDDERFISYVTMMLNVGKIRSRAVRTALEAVTLLHTDSVSIISVVLDLHLEAEYSGLSVIQEIESRYSQIPYTVFTEDRAAIKTIPRQYPRAKVLMKDDDVMLLANALGVENCA